MNFKFEIKTRIMSKGFSEVRFIAGPVEGSSTIIASFPYVVNNKFHENGVRISPFAQKNHYLEAVKRLKDIVRYIREIKSLSKKDIRIFCNSQLEEKWFGASSGLGFYGRNSLIITQMYGSRVILAGLIVPIIFDYDAALQNGTIPGTLCGSCRNCVKTCPTSAIKKSGKIDRDKCLQSLTTDARELPEFIMEQWGNRLYGCSICQDCCPFNKKDNPQNMEITGVLGESIPFEIILSSSDEEIKAYLKGSALSMSWIQYDLLRRNAMISAVFEKRTDLIQLIEKYLDHPSIAYAAKWSLNRLKSDFNNQAAN